MNQRLARIAVSNPIPDMGDRTIQGQTMFIDNAEWQIWTDYQQGSIGDVSVFRNTNVHNKEAEPTWQWYAGIPSANVKAYRLLDNMPGIPDGEPQAKTPQARSTAGAGK